MAANMPDIVLVPEVPTPEVLANAMNSAQGQIATIQDIYHDLANTAQEPPSPLTRAPAIAFHSYLCTLRQTMLDMA